MTLRHQTFSVTTDASGDGSDTQPVLGKILRIDTDATAADTAGCDVTWAISANAGRNSLAETVLTLTDLGDASAVDYPRRLVQGTDGVDLTGASGGDREPFIATGQVKMTVAQGGATKAYTGVVWYED